MSVMLKWVISTCLVVAAPARAQVSAPAAAAARYAKRCQPVQGTNRINDQQGTMLWGSWSGWTDREQRKANEQKSVLVSADLDGLLVAPEGAGSLRLEGGHLSGGKSVVSSVLRGMTSDGAPTEVAICGAQPSERDPGMVWYQIEVWNPVAEKWANPCVPSGDVPEPRALAVAGVWDTTGAHHDVAGKLTFACWNGVVAKCARWGYQPWATRNGRSLADVHQACTRMARADYCGNGKTHTKEKTDIEYYDSDGALGISARMTRAVSGWDPARASFEAAWAPDGASCLARTRHGEPLAAITQECPGRFKEVAVELGGGDRCAVQRADSSPPSGLLRNRVNGNPGTP